MYAGDMRTTVSLDPDVASAVARRRREDGLGLSEAVNALIRQGLTAAEAPGRYEPWARDLGARVDVANIGDVLDLLDDA